MAVITRAFLGLERPGLLSASEYLLDRYTSGNVSDLSGVIVVVPGRRAGRRLLELVVAGAEQRHSLLTPPLVETVGRVAEHLYTAQREFASDLTQELVWAKVLREADEDVRAALLPRRPPDDSPRWLEIAKLLRRQHIELAAEGLDFNDVAGEVDEVGGGDETRRWKAMAQLQDVYHRTLDGIGLWDRQTARLKAIEYDECRTERSVILVGTVDMNVALTNMLDQIADHVTALIVAPEAWSDRFDMHGRLLADRWQTSDIEIPSEAIEVVDRPRDQAAAAVRQLAAIASGYHVDEVTIGVPNEHLIGELERQLNDADVPSRWGPGKSLEESGPFRLLSLIADLLAHRRFADFAEFARHPDVDGWLQANGAEPWLTELDRYQADHLPYRMPRKWLGRRSDALEFLSSQVEQLLAPLSSRPQQLHAWREPLSDLLMTVYGHRRLNQEVAGDKLIIKACGSFIKALDEHVAVPHVLMPTVSAVKAIRMALEDVAREQIAAETGEAIELLGWLELPLDDAPALIVTGLNEGYVPQSVNSDLFMPNALRTRIGLLDNPQRYARDAYALQVLLLTRQSVHFVVGRRTIDGDPLLPSRLLFATSPATIAERAQNFFSVALDADRLAAAPPAADDPEPGLAIPRPAPLDTPPNELRVTGFRDYLACPYRFYLRHILRLEVLEDHADEMGGGAFGIAAHEILRRFGSSLLRGATDPVQISGFLNAELDQYAKAHYGADAMPAVRVQIEQLRLRLKAFADWQANHALEGWQIEFVETGATQSVPFDVDGVPISLRGRIDRIDFHPESGRRMILDYKTSDVPKTPDTVHLHHGRWTDLQLPLYRHLATDLGPTGPFELGYVLLPRDTAKLTLAKARWSDEQLSAADEVAREVVRGIRRQEFWPPTDPPPEFSEEFAAICQDGVLSR